MSATLRNLCRGGDCPPLPGAGLLRRVKVLTWNANALCHQQARTRDRKRHLLNEWLNGVDIAGLQEVHGAEEDVRVYFPELDRHFRIASSGCESNAAGGVLTLVSRRLVIEEESFVSKSWVAGRVLRTQFSSSGVTGVIWNIHNHDLSQQDLREVSAQMLGDALAAKEDPLHHCVFVLGDFNFSSADMPAVKASTAELATEQSGTRPGQKAFEDALSSLVELATTTHTRFDASGNAFTALDRVFCSTPSWALVSRSVSASVLACPQRLSRDGISDHAPVEVEIAIRPMLPPSQRAIHHAVFSSDAFAKALAGWEQHIDLDALPLWERWQTHKRILRTAAGRARKVMMANAEGFSKDASALLVLNSVARAVALQDHQLANKLRSTSTLACELLSDEISIVQLKHPAGFSDKIAEARAADPEAREHQRTKKAKPGSKRFNGHRRLQQLWRPYAKRLVLHAVRDDRGKIFRGDRVKPLR